MWSTTRRTEGERVSEWRWVVAQCERVREGERGVEGGGVCRMLENLNLEKTTILKKTVKVIATREMLEGEGEKMDGGGQLHGKRLYDNLQP
jgi:hypothetical protein